MHGWKTLTGAILFGLGGVARAVGYGEIGNLLEGVGGALGVVGIGHKIEKASRGPG